MILHSTSSGLAYGCLAHFPFVIWVSKGLVGLAVYNDVMVFISFLVSLSTDAFLVQVFLTGGSIN
jgi:hypothetical protein